jgi:transcriptional regulator with XRE-family HTH domain
LKIKNTNTFKIFLVINTNMYIIVEMVNTIIKKLRELGLSQSEISKRANVPQSRISDIENGKQSTISYEAGKRLEALLAEIIQGDKGEKRSGVDRRADRRKKTVVK